MAALYWIDLGMLRHESLKDEFGYDFYDTFDCLGRDESKIDINIKNLLKELRKTNPEIHKSGELKDPKHPIYFNLLANYLAIISKESIEILLTQLFKDIPFQFQKLGYKILEENYKCALLQYRRTQPNIFIKLERIKEWLEQNKSLRWAETPRQLESDFFMLSEQMIHKITNFLYLDNIIEENMVENVKSFFKNDFTVELRLNVKKNRFIELLKRILGENLKQGNKKDFVRVVHKKLLFKEGAEYKHMDFEYFYRLMTEEGKNPLVKLMSEYTF